MESGVIRGTLRELAEWRPPGGVLSIYVDIDPADRSEGWRTKLRERLAAVDENAAARVRARFPDNAPHPEGRTQVGFVEIAKGGREIWHGFQARVGEVIVVEAAGPYLSPLVRVLDGGGPIGIVVTALERVRVLEWGLGRVEELEGWELEVTSLDWRERKSPQRNPQSDGTGTSASGREQYMQRLEHNRERFLKQAGELIADRYGERGWRRIIVFGEGDRPRLVAAGLRDRAELVHESPHDLIGAGAAEIGARAEAQFEHLNREREEGLMRRLQEAIGAEPSPALGPDEVLQALEEGRVRHLIFDAERELQDRDGAPANERLISLALTTSAELTPAEGLAARALDRHGGVVALLRY